MELTMKKGDLFSAPQPTHFVHCVSGDFALGKGIALEFQRRYTMRDKLRQLYPLPEKTDYLKTQMNFAMGKPHVVKEVSSYSTYLGRALLVGNVFNLVTKERYWMKPTTETMRCALISLKRICLQQHIKALAMPQIGCGLDRMSWTTVERLLHTVFDDTDINITVYYLQHPVP